MPHTRSASKRDRQNAKRRLHNRAVKKACKTQIKKFLATLNDGNVKQAQVEYSHAARLLDKAAAKGIIHRNLVARKKSQLARQMNQATVPTTPPQLQKARELTARGESLFLGGSLERAATRFAAAVQVLSNLQGQYPMELSAARVNHAVALAEIGHVSEAEAELRECLRLCSDTSSTQADALARADASNSTLFFAVP